MDLSLFVCGTALFDSVSTTLQIVVLILLFSSARPVRTSLAFLAGVSLAYLACGLGGLALVGRLNEMVRLFVPDLSRVPDGAYYRAVLTTGLLLTAAGPLWGLYLQRRKKRPEHRWMTRLKAISPLAALGLGAVLAVSSFPTALPYVAALEKIAASTLPPPGQVAEVVLYNLVYALPMVIPFVLFVFLREAVVPQLRLHVQTVNRWITILLLSAAGLFSVADAGAYFATGRALVSTRFF